MTTINFAGILDHSTLDYPGEVCAVIYLCGCPFRCPWCQNTELVLCNESVCKFSEITQIVEQLKKNFLIGAVCITGGEPLMQNETVELLKEIKKETKLKVKVDTNGYFPENLKKALQFVDFVSMDLKAPLNENYGKVVGLPFQSKKILEKVKESLAILKNWKGEKEARTTIVPGLIDNAADIKKIAKIVFDTKFSIYTLQQFRAEKTLDPKYKKLKIPSLELMRNLGKKAKKELPNVKVQIVTQQKGFEEMEF